MRLESSRPVLAVTDLAVSSSWFAAIFECTLHDIDNGNWIFADNGAVTFMLGHCPDVMPVTAIGDHAYVAYLTVDDVDAVYQRALAHGATILKPPTAEPWGRIEMAIQSPDGHRFMVAQ